LALTPGSRLGPYEIVAPIGAGGMGEVYRARDERLKRDVAIKVLPATYSQDADRLRRFEHEAQAAGGLNHPNITAVYDLGSHDGSPYIVTELLEGETLRARLSGGAIAVRKATDYAVQIAKGLAAAHEKGIIHRDLKPENLFLTNDGRVKILDFGLAKLTQIEAAPNQTNLPTASGTEPGVVMGTLGYMSPEQVKGKPADQRSDIFAFGAILYEMLSGQRAFSRDSAAETMSAILREEPPDLSATNKSVQPGLERIVRHCLEKNPEERFYSARDVAFDLEALSGLSAPQAASAGRDAVRRRPVPALAAILAVALAAAAGYWIRAREAPPKPPSFHQLTFRRGTIWNARFGADGKSVLYSAAWDGGDIQVFVGRVDGPDARPFDLPGANVLAVSPSGEIAVALRSKFAGSFSRTGTLARVAASGAGAPREILEGVESADFTPDGKDLAIVRAVSGKYRLECPIGKVLYETAGWIGEPRVSPGGDRIAFVDHPVRGDDGGGVSMVDLAGKKTVLLPPTFATAQGLAWSPDGREVWFTAAEVGGNRALHAVSTSGRARVLFRGTGVLKLQDVARDGRALLVHDVLRVGIAALAPGETSERDLSWLDWGLISDVSPDGRWILFSETGEGGGPGYSVYERAVDGSPPVRLGEGASLAISPDGKKVLAVLHPTSDEQLIEYPTGPGEQKIYALRGLRVPGPENTGDRIATWLPDSRHFLVTASAPGRPRRVYLVDSQGGDPRPLTTDGFSLVDVVDARRFIATQPDGSLSVRSIEGDEVASIQGVSSGDTVVGAARAGWVYAVRDNHLLPAKIDRVEFATGRKEAWKQIAPPDLTGVVGLDAIRITPEGNAYTYSYGRVLSDLFVADGLK
jgi:Tol biopolymer transport system component